MDAIHKKKLEVLLVMPIKIGTLTMSYWVEMIPSSLIVHYTQK